MPGLWSHLRSQAKLYVALFVAFAGAAGAFQASALASAGGGASSEPPGEYCDGCLPPLKYSGGPVMGTLGGRGVTVTPVYWAAPGARNRFPRGYESVVNGFVENVAAASGADTNVFSIDSEYYDILGAQPSHIRYRVTAGAPIVITRRLPVNHCASGAPGYHACVTDSQLKAELTSVLDSRHLPRGLAYFYPVFFPPGVETQADADDNSATTYCAYHSNFRTGTSQIVYGNEPFPSDGCDTGQSPNGNAAADAVVSPLSHELNESITDPEVDYGRIAWQDRDGDEVGDLCNFEFGTPIGSTNPGAPESTEYNQLINGGHYYIQVEFSNYAYRRLGVGLGCQPSERAARHSSATSNASPTHIYFDMSRNTLPANGKARSNGLVQVWDRHGVDTPGDRIVFNTYSLFGRGNCGRLKPHSAKTDGAGTVGPVYRASRANIACVIVATDAEGGRSASVVIYQGKARERAPRARAKFPRRITAGRTLTFTTSFRNPSHGRIGDAQVNLGIFVPFDNSPNVSARKIHLSVSWRGRRGPFKPVRLTGSTAKDAGIIGVIGGAAGFNLRARHNRTLTYRLQVSKTVPLRRGRPILQFQAFLDQVDPASGAQSVLAATPATNARVR